MEPGSREQVCSICGLTREQSSLATGCSHTGEWHSNFSDCGIRCAVGLGKKGKLGQQHWSCCFSTDFASPCPSNTSHTWEYVSKSEREDTASGMQYCDNTVPETTITGHSVPETSILGRSARAQLLRQPSQAQCVTCGVCISLAGENPNCIHSGEWHASFQDCSPRCAWALGKEGKLGQQHWSCCFSTNPSPRSICKIAAHRFVQQKIQEYDNCAETEIGKGTQEVLKETAFSDSDVPRYTVNLDAAPKERWRHVIEAHLQNIPAALAVVDDVLGPGFLQRGGLKVAEAFFSVLAHVGHVSLGEELQGIAAAAGVSLGRVVLMQIAYETCAACTSIVAQSDTYPVHIRTMDWHMPQLRQLTCEIEMVKNGEIICVASTWVGYVGFLTGLKPGEFSVSVNYRRTKPGDDNMLKMVLHNLSRGLFRRHWPVSFLVRATLEQCQGFHQAVNALNETELMAPVYFTVAGADPGQGQVIARDREGGSKNKSFYLEETRLWPWQHGVVNSLPDSDPAMQVATAIENCAAQANDHHREAQKRLLENKISCTANGWSVGPKAVVQANMDIDRDELLCAAGLQAAPRHVVEKEIWQDICESRHRRLFGLAALAASQASNAGMLLKDLWLIASTPPILAHDTIYTTAMIPATGLLVTRQDATLDQRWAGTIRFGELAEAVDKAHKARENEESANFAPFPVSTRLRSGVIE